MSDSVWEGPLEIHLIRQGRHDWTWEIRHPGQKPSVSWLDPPPVAEALCTHPWRWSARWSALWRLRRERRKIEARRRYSRDDQVERV